MEEGKSKQMCLVLRLLFCNPLSDETLTQHLSFRERRNRLILCEVFVARLEAEREAYRKRADLLYHPGKSG